MKKTVHTTDIYIYILGCLILIRFFSFFSSDVPSPRFSIYGYHLQKSMDQPGKVNPARGQLTREN